MLHSPNCIYYLKEKLEESSFSVIFDDLNHDAGFVSQVIHQTFDHIKTSLYPSITKIRYFSDGCIGQYKNCKHFYNLCHHVEDFFISCIWNFFATSHGKSPCDGIGGTEKRLVGTTSLQNPVSNQILSAEAMFKFCQQSINAIKFVYVTVEEMEHEKNLLIDFL